MSSRFLFSLLIACLLMTSTGCLDLMIKYGELHTEIQGNLDNLFAHRSYTKVEIQVLDGDTLEPIRGAEVFVNNCAPGNLFRDDSSGVTDREGKVTLRVVRISTPSDYLPSADVHPERYMPPVADETPLGADPPPFRVLHLYRPPRPYHVLEVPVGFEGLLEIRIPHFVYANGRPTPRDWPDWRPGEREFVTRLDTTALTELRLLPDMGLTPQDHMAICGARFSDGTPLLIWHRSQFRAPPPQAPPATQPAFDNSTIAMWEVRRRARGYYCFWVGTLRRAHAEQDRLYEQSDKSDPLVNYYFPKLQGLEAR